MIAAELFTNEETKKAAMAFALNYRVKTETLAPDCNSLMPDERFPDNEEIKLLRDAFIAGAVWNKLNPHNLIFYE